MTACAHTSSAPRQESISLALPGLPKPLGAWLQLPRGYDDDSRVWPLVVCKRTANPTYRPSL